MKILIKVSGSISAYKVCTLVSSLVKEGHEVKVACSRSASKFVGPATWEALSGNPVFLDDFAPNQRMDHIYLNDWADLVVLAPASAQTLNSISSGVGSGVLTTLFLARNKETPYLIFPAMNPRMWTSESVESSVEKLSKMERVKIFSPDSGVVACGHEGVGRLAEPSFILDQILKLEKKSQKVLVTFGGTSESIDDVRFISNFSTGKTGVEICKKLKSKFNVVALGSNSALLGAAGLEGVRTESFVSSSDLGEKLFNLIETENFDLIVHAAAISDFIPSQKFDKKISSSENLEIKLVKAPKVLDGIKQRSLNKKIKVISFKLTHNQSEDEVLEKIESQFKNSKSDYIVHNKLTEVSGVNHEYSIWERDGQKPIHKGSNKEELTDDLLEIGGL